LGVAEAVAVQEDPTVKGLREKSFSLQERAVADGQLPDPKVRLGLLNFPTDTFNRSQEPMTQVQVGVQQDFPRGKTLDYTARRSSILADAEQARAADRDLKVLKAVRTGWLETYYWVQATTVVSASQELFTQLVNITRARYAAGQRNQQEVLRAELELGLLDDRQTRIRTMEERMRADLARWVGEERAAWRLPPDLPELPPVSSRDALAAALPRHPSIVTENANVAAGQQSVAIAREAYKPRWRLDLAYGFRDGDNPDGRDRPDLASAAVSVDVPLFVGKRQDRRLAASQHELNAIIQGRHERHRELVRVLDETFATWQRLGERIRQYETALLPQAEETADAAISAYQSNRGDFTLLMRARITELEMRLQSLRLRVDRAKAQAGLLYLAGENR
jgi:outer membrane protein TolC